MGLDLTGQAIDNQLLSKVDAPIGTYRDSDLTVSAFNAENLGEWMLCNGQDCSSTEYFALTGKTNVPNFLAEGTFRRQAKAGRALGSYEEDEIKSHNHSVPNVYPNQTINEYGHLPYSSDKNSTYQATTNTGGDETRPKNIACNVFIKVGH